MIKSYSLYGQARWKILPTLELAGGARWTDETRRQLQSLLFPALPFTTPTPRIHSSRVSPEVTLTYKPTPDLTLFAAYKKGNKSGSFSIATPVQPTPAPPAQPLDNSFGDESVSGFEGGIKGRLLDRQLNFSLTGYDYKYRGLQVGAIEPSVGILQNIRTVNAGLGRAYGAELELNYHPRAIDGLNVNTSLDWNHTRFIVLNNIPCYGGQEVSEGCNQQFNAATGLYFAQDASGLPFIRAPRWQTNFGLDYELPIGKYKLIFSNSNHYSSRYLTDLGMDYFQKGFIKSDISLTLQGPSDRWEIAVIGKNVTEKLTASACNNSNVANGLVLGGQVTGGTTRGPAGVDEVGCYMDPGRELWLRVTFRPFS
jgi:outer membrane receptor protein involved in Fe transport